MYLSSELPFISFHRTPTDVMSKTEWKNIDDKYFCLPNKSFHHTEKHLTTKSIRNKIH